MGEKMEKAVSCERSWQPIAILTTETEDTDSPDLIILVGISG